jgi:nitrite reductase/ring-hydroxylating ferredoxin subunit
MCLPPTSGTKPAEQSVDRDNFDCTLHGWKFSLEDGHCHNAAEHTIRIKKRSRSSSTACQSHMPFVHFHATSSAGRNPVIPQK